MSGTADSIRCDALGPIGVHVGGAEITVSARRDRVVLAMLLLSAPAPVGLSPLVEAVWGERPPYNARNQLQGCVSRLRKRFADAGVTREIIVTDQTGYRIRVEPPELDLLEFRRLRDEARTATAAGRAMDAHDHYRAAIGCWRGPALAGIDSDQVRRAAAALDEERAQVQEECLRLALDLDLGEPGELVTEIRALVREHPYREAPQAALLRALYRAGRQADALAAYRDFRRLLSHELGTEPGDELQRLHRAILSHDTDLDAAQPSPPAPAPAARLVPRELPAEVSGFTGRADALAVLDDLLAGEPARTGGPVVISAIAGTAGVGKTALAVHWAHRVADRFPDGQLYLDLRGYASGPPLRPVEALAALLRSLGVPSEQIPTEETQAAALLRTRLSDQRTLLVLDNARSVDQVRPLLPGSPTCLVLVTSRDRLSGLVARDGAHRHLLDVLPAAEAHALLTHMLGTERVEAEPGAVTELARACAHLPLALRIAAAHIADHPARTIASYVAELTTGDRLTALQSDGDQENSVLATLDLSYRTLQDGTARLYRLLGLHPGPDIEPYAAAAIAGTTLERARRGLDQLLDAHLLQEPSPSRYVFHDLVRAHATRTAATTETEPDQQAAVSRLRGHYRHTASIAMDTSHPYERERRPHVPRAGTPTPGLSDPARAIAWLDRELPNLLAAATHAADRGWPEHLWNLSAILHRHLRTRGRYRDAETLHNLALTAARTTGHRASELDAVIGLGEIHQLQGRIRQATQRYRQALDIARMVGHRTGELTALIDLGEIRINQGEYQQATDHYQQALDIARTTGSRAGELSALIPLADIHYLQSRYEPAIELYQQARDLARVVGHRTGELSALTGLANIHLHLGRYEPAADHFELALEIARAVGHRAGELNALRGLGRAHRLQGRYEQAIGDFRQALEIARTIGNRSGELSTLVGLGWVHHLQGRHDQAADLCQRALHIAREISDRNWQFEALHGLGRVHHATHRPEAALANHGQALELAADLGQPSDQVRAHDGLAHAYHALRQPESARRHWQHALDLLTGLGIDRTADAQANAVTIRAQLAALDEQPRTLAESSRHRGFVQGP